jgi:hypothetical protein
MDELISLPILDDFVSGWHGVSSWKINKSIWHSIWIWCWRQRHGIIILGFTIVLIIMLASNSVPYTFVYELLYSLMQRQYLWPSQIYVNMNRGTKRKKAIRKSQLH